MAAARMYQQVTETKHTMPSLGLMAVYLLSSCIRDSWASVDVSMPIWSRIIDILQSSLSDVDADRSPRSSSQTRRAPSRTLSIHVHNLLNSLCTPTSTPDETGILWTSDIVRRLCEMHRVPFEESSLSAISSPFDNRSTVAGKVWNRLGKRLAPSAREPIVAQTVRPTKRGMTLFYEYMLELVQFTIPFDPTTRMFLVDDL
jgi:hypothetical protein